MVAHVRRNLVAYVALFLAIPVGSAVASKLVTGADIAPDAITGAHIQDGTILNQDIAGQAAIDGSKIDASSLGGVVHGNGHQVVHHLTLQPAGPPHPPTSEDMTIPGFDGTVSFSCFSVPSGPDEYVFSNLKVKPSAGGFVHLLKPNQLSESNALTLAAADTLPVGPNDFYDEVDAFVLNNAAGDHSVLHIRAVLWFDLDCRAFVVLTAL